MTTLAPPPPTSYSMLTQPAAFTGFLLRDGRRAGLCWDEKPRCVNDHRLKAKDGRERTIARDALLTCVHREQRGAEPCGARLYVALLTFGGSAVIRGSGERCWLVVEVTDAHVREMAARPMIFLETMSLLQCVLPGVAFDLPGTRDDEES